MCMPRGQQVARTSSHRLWCGLPSLKKQEQRKGAQARPLLLQVLLRGQLWAD